MNRASLVFPHQLFKQHPALLKQQPVYLIEESLFFTYQSFCKQKLVFHRASMKHFQLGLEKLGYQVHYIEANDARADVSVLIEKLHQIGFKELDYCEVCDDYLERRLEKATELGMALNVRTSPMFLNSRDDLKPYFRSEKKKFLMAQFYKKQRIKKGILLEGKDIPKGGKWSFDHENRKKYPKDKTPPHIAYPDKTQVYSEALSYVKDHFSAHPGQLSEQPLYPYTFEQAKVWWNNFLDQRFAGFGPYEDAIVKGQSILHHSVITPMLNVGLLTPEFIVNSILEYAQEHDIAINSVEGFIRQVIGWREFMRGLYVAKGPEMRTKNYWGFTRKIPPSFYDGSTGIDPLDATIKEVLKTGYCHHIERLMVLGNFMLLCEFDPDEVYRWFMELFIDSYDWVMVPNVYGMSQFADGGIFATKPYISSSNYIMKMSNYAKGAWQETWDALFWRFMDMHRDFFLSNPRLGMLLRTFDKKSAEAKEAIYTVSERFLEDLDT